MKGASIKKTAVIAVIIVLAALFGVAHTHTWWHQEAAKGHHLSISPISTWGFYNLEIETQALCGPGEACNQGSVTHQCGPIRDEWGYRAP